MLLCYFVANGADVTNVTNVTDVTNWILIDFHIDYLHGVALSGFRFV
jgi:hypothetical protein